MQARGMVELSERSLTDELCEHPHTLRIGWPKQTLEALAGVVERCTELYAKRRSVILAEMGELEMTLSRSCMWQ